jgi:putative flippase GtrA
MAPGLRALAAARAELALQALRYGLAGTTAVAFLFVVLVAQVELLGVPKTLASAIAFASAIPVNYLLQRRFVFAAGGGYLASVARHLVVTGLTLGLNTLLFWLLVERLGTPYTLAQLLVIAIVVPVSFVLNRHYTFGRNRPASGIS